MADEFITVARADQVIDHQLRRVEVDERPVVLTRVDGRLCALSAICTHEHVELVSGEVDEDTLWCPVHASGFNVFTGEVTSLPATEPLPVYDVREVDGLVQVSRRPRA
jgi:nitrite reductase/ring-hydroxylating ferredoxin subunit